MASTANDPRLQVPQSYLAYLKSMSAEFVAYGTGVPFIRDAMIDADGYWNGPVQSVVYPPVGFLQWEICDVGNGDCFGYYWPVGKERDPPLVAMISHDCGALIPTTTSLETLAVLEPWQRDLQKLRPIPEAKAKTDDPPIIDLRERLSIDPESPFLLVANADLDLGEGNLDLAETRYLAAARQLPEYTAAHLGLVTLYRRLRKPGTAAKWMLAALRSPFCFWGASFWAETNLPNGPVNRDDYRRKCLHWLRQASATDEISADPLYGARERLQFKSGLAVNHDYEILEGVIDEYVRHGRHLEAIHLYMLFGELMHGETTPFRERSGFTHESHRRRLLDLFQTAGLKGRAALLETTPNDPRLA